MFTPLLAGALVELLVVGGLVGFDGSLTGAVSSSTAGASWTASFGSAIAASAPSGRGVDSSTGGICVVGGAHEQEVHQVLHPDLVCGYGQAVLRAASREGDSNP